MLKNFSGLLAGILLLFVFLPAVAQGTKATMLDRVLVVVNDDIITFGEFETALNGMRKQLAAAGKEVPPEKLLKEKVLEQLVFDKLLQLHAAETGINVTDDMLDRAMDRLAKQNNMSVPQVLAQLKEDGVSEALFKENLRKQLLIQRVIDRDVKGSVSVLDSEVEGILRNQSTVQPDRVYDVSLIQLAVSEEASPAEIEKVVQEASDLRQRIVAGNISFDKAARNYSIAGNAADGGALGWKTVDKLPTLFADALSEMNEGDISGPLVSPGGIFLLRLNQLKGGQNQQIVSQSRARHILLKATNKVDIQHAMTELENVRQKIIAGEDFGILAAEISQDPGSAIKGGELGWLNKGDTVPEFEKAMDDLQVGEISQPIVSQFGVHLIQLQERREVDISEQKRRDAIRQQIGKRKVAEKYDQFLKQLKSRAYIDYRTPLDEI
jgi:peptidyl-prolyl cis-trans isomerase SurA